MAINSEYHELRSLAAQIRRWNITHTVKTPWRISDRGSNWFRLQRLKLSRIKDEGVYVINNGLLFGTTLYVGQGKIADRLSEHRRVLEKSVYRMNQLWVAWAPVPTLERNCVERYLFNYYKPILGERTPRAIPKRVNLPSLTV